MTQLEYGKVDRNRGKTKSESIKRGLARSAMDPNSALFSKKCYEPAVQKVLLSNYRISLID